MNGGVLGLVWAELGIKIVMFFFDTHVWFPTFSKTNNKTGNIITTTYTFLSRRPYDITLVLSSTLNSSLLSIKTPMFFDK